MKLFNLLQILEPEQIIVIHLVDDDEYIEGAVKYSIGWFDYEEFNSLEIDGKINIKENKVYVEVFNLKDYK